MSLHPVYEKFQRQISWERYFSMVLKSIVYDYPDLPNKSQKKNMYNTIINVAFLIPHDYYRKYYLEYIENVSVVNYLDKKKHMMNYIYEMYTYIYEKCKAEFNAIKMVENNKRFEDLYAAKPMSYEEFWNDYLNIYKILKYYNPQNYKVIRWILLTIVVLVLLYFVFKYYNMYILSLGNVVI